MWVGGVADSQTRSKPLKKKTKSPQKLPFLTQISPMVLPNLTKKTGVGKHIWENFFGRFLPNVGGWGGWFPDKVQTPKKEKITPKIAFFDPKFIYRSLKSYKKPWGG